MIAKKGKTNYNKTMKVKKTTKPRAKKKKPESGSATRINPFSISPSSSFA